MARTNTKQAVLIDRLPATPVTPEIREQMVARAKKAGISIAELQREAFGFFLSRDYSKTIVDNTEAIDKGRKPA